MCKKRFLLLVCLCGSFFLCSTASAQVIISSQTNWRESINENSLATPSEAGSDLTSVIETTTDFNLLNIQNVANTTNWKVSISRQDINWPSAFTLQVRRNSSGLACAGCSGLNLAKSPSSYLTIVPLETDFIFGTGEVTGIELQFKLSGLSLTVEANSYSTNVVYTLYGD